MATYKVGANGKAQSGLRAGDEVVTGGGTYRITGVNEDGSYRSEKVNSTTVNDYAGEYAGKDYYFDTRKGPAQTGFQRADGSGADTTYKDTTPYAKGTKGSYSGADMTRDTRLAGQTVEKNGYAITYDEDGYAVKALNVRAGTRGETLANAYPRVDASGERIYPTYADGSVGQGYSGGTGSNGNVNSTIQQIVQSSVGGGGTTGGYNSFQEYLNDMGYSDYSKATQDAIRASVQAAVDGYNAQIESTNQDAEKAARQAYIAKRLGEKNLDQQLAANGYAGGMADSQRIAQEANYQNELAELEQQRLNTVGELERAIENARLTGDMQTAQELSAYLQQVESQWANYINTRLTLEQQAAENQRSEETTNYWRQQELDAENRSSAYERALTLIAAGVMPDTETLSAAGISQTEANGLLGRTGSGVQTASYSIPATQSAQTATTPTASTSTASSGSTQVGGATYSDIKRTILTLVAQGNLERANSVYQQYWDSLSEAQKAELNRALGG